MFKVGRQYVVPHGNIWKYFSCKQKAMKYQLMISNLIKLKELV